MPMPKPMKREAQEHYIKRVITNSMMMREFPNVKQRIAIAYNQLRKIHRKVKPV